jgi:hypothetical protein
LLTLLVLFFFVRCRLSIVICVEYLLCKLDAKLAFLNPRGFWLKLNIGFFELELLQNYVLIYARNHVRRFDERKTEGRFEVYRSK